MRQSSLVAQTAERIERYASDNPTLRILPSRHILAQQFAVSEMTTARAIRLLCERGVVSCRKGRRPLIVGRESGSPEIQERTSAEARLALELRRRVSDGTLMHGAPLPKVAYLSFRERITNRTVVRAYSLLGAEGLAHRVGKRWIVGQAPGSAMGKSRGDPPVILLLGIAEHTWRGLYVPRTEAFCRSFSREAERFGVQLLPVAARRLGPEYGFYAQGRAEIADLVRQLGKRYLGTLVASTRAELPDLEDWIAWLEKLARPVVWFDRTDERGGFCGSRISARCHFSEHAALDLAVSHLLDSGHRTIGYVGRNEDWVSARERHLRAVIRDRNPEAVLVGITTTTRYPSLSRAHLAVRGLTALVAPNDHDARHIFYSLRRLGIAVPGELSLLSFDNYPELLPLPVSTVDFGFDHIGYCAFHLLVRDVPIRTDQWYGVSARPRLVPRGSVRNLSC